MASVQSLPANTKCLGTGCVNDAGTLQCPTCLKLGINESFFCSQDCFKKNWSSHKSIHGQNSLIRSIIPPKVISRPDPVTGTYNPFPAYSFTGPLRPVYPLSPTRVVPSLIQRPDYAESGASRKERVANLYRTKFDILDADAQEAMRKACKIGREVLDIVAAEVKPGVTTDYLDEICHEACIKRDSYPSPLNYSNFPKSICISANEVACHGIPDQRKLEDGDIVNLDVTVFHGGYHADLNETYYVGERAKANPDAVRVVETARECLDLAIRLVKPGTPIRDFGDVIEKHAISRGCSIIKTWGGHGINTNFHPPPFVPHYAKNKAVGVCKAGMTFTIEPIVSLGSHRDVYWPDRWTSVTVDGKWTAQFEHTLLVTETGVEVLTASNENSPGGPVPLPATTNPAAKTDTVSSMKPAVAKEHH